MSILFINGSPNKDGNTVKLAANLLSDKTYQTINLVDYKLYSYGQKFGDDQFDEIVAAMKAPMKSLLVRPFIGTVCVVL